MMLSPPTWMRARTTAWPKVDRSEAVSTTMSPVTQTALVAVKTASESRSGSGPAEALGKARRIVPTPMNTRNEISTSRAGCP